MSFVHSELAAGRWQTFTLAEQMGNIGSEISRAIKWKNKNDDIFRNAIFRALELLDLTITDKRWVSGVKEITRVKEVLCDIVFGEGQYHTRLEDLDKYFSRFALAARKKFHSDTH